MNPVFARPLKYIVAKTMPYALTKIISHSARENEVLYSQEDAIKYLKTLFLINDGKRRAERNERLAATR